MTKGFIDSNKCKNFFVEWGTRDPGYTLDGKFHEVSEMIPELVVPDLTGFQVSNKFKNKNYC